MNRRGLLSFLGLAPVVPIAAALPRGDGGTALIEKIEKNTKDFNARLDDYIDKRVDRRTMATTIHMHDPTARVLETRRFKRHEIFLPANDNSPA